jgi:hypothetical protein
MPSRREEAVTQYLLIYQGQMDGPMPELSQDENDATMQAWGDWMGRVGAAPADGGAPTCERARVGGSGVRLPITGYDIVDADSLEAAKALCDSHPFLARALADFSVDVYELIPSRWKAARAACARGSSDWFGTRAVRVTEQRVWSDAVRALGRVDGSAWLPTNNGGSALRDADSVGEPSGCPPARVTPWEVTDPYASSH